MGVTQRRLCTLLVFFIVIIETTGIDINDTSPDGNRRSPGRGRITKQYSGTRPEPILCTDEGFQSDPHNCATFYRCVKSGNYKYTVFRFQCGPGTIYDPDEKVCNHPQNTRRAECGGFLPPLINDSHSNEIQGPMYNEIPSPMVTNKPELNAEGTSPSNTQESTMRPYPWVSSTNPGYMDHNAMIMKPINTESNIPHPISRDNICTSDGFMGDVENCRKFYRCVANQRGGYTRYEFSCTETTIWDDYNKICNHIWAVRKTRCSLLSDKITMSNNNLNNENVNSWEKNDTKNPIRENTPNKNVQNQLQIGYGTQVTQTQTQISNGLVNQNQSQINYGDRLNKNKNEGSKQNQTQISHGSAISQSQTQVDYGNKGVQTQLQIDHSNQASQNQIQITDSSTNKVSTTLHNSDGQQSDKHDSVECTEAGFIGDSTDCAKFYRCIDNGQGGFKKFGFSCADGTAWDPSLETCNHIWALKGCNSQSIGSTTQTSTTARDKTTQNYYTTTSTEHPTPQLTGNYNENTGYEYPKPESTSTSSLSPTSTTMLDAKGTECTSSGFMGDDNNCKIFYRCVENSNGGFTKYVFNCGEGTVWDPEIIACNHAWAVEKCGGNAYPDINKVDTTTERQISSSPVYIQSTAATHLPTETFPDPEYEDNDIGYGSSNNDIHKTTTSSKPQPIMNHDDHICKSSGFIGDEHDCQKFYRCVDNGEGGFIRYEFTCSEGTVWDSEISTCNHASAVDGCNKTPTTKKPKQENENNGNITDNHNKTTTTSKPITTTISTTTPTAESVLIDSGKCTQSGFMGDPNDCKKFFRCVDDGSGSYTKFEFRCGEGTVWDDEIKSCNHAWAVTKCGISSGSSPVNDEINNDYTSENTTKPSEVITKTTTTENSAVINTSLGTSSTECESEGFFAVPNNCKNFIRCVNNNQGGFTKHEFTCSEGTVWVQEMLTCYHYTGEIDQLSSCQGSVMYDEDNTQTTQSSATTEATKTEATASQDLTSTKTTTSVSSTTQTSIPNSEQSSNSDSLNTDSCNSEGFYGNTQDCKKFYRCVSDGKGGYTKYDFDCAEGTIWDKDVTTCNHPENVVHPSCNLTQDNNTTEDSSKNPSSNINCTKAGFYANPNDCKKFYRCVDWDGNQTKFSIYHFECGEGTIWDPAIETCNHEDSVYPPRNCSGGSQSQSSTTEGTATTENESPTQSISQTTSESTNQLVTESTSQSAAESTTLLATESTTSSANELTTTSPTEPSTLSGTESTIHSATESTTTATTESTTHLATESISTSATESTTMSTTESTTLSATESTTLSVTESTTPSATESTTTSTTELSTPSGTESISPSATESTIHPATESTTTSTTESTTHLATESISTSTTESTTMSTTESTTLSASESTTLSVTESTTPSATESTTTSTTELSTLSGTESVTPSAIESTSSESTNLSATESTTLSATESTTRSATESTTPSVTELTAPSATESATPSVTESTIMSTFESSTLSTTELTTPSVTELTASSTTESATPSVTESTIITTIESSTLSTTESTTLSVTESTTLSTTESTTHSATELTTTSTTESTTPSVTELTAPSATKSTTPSVTESTIMSTTESSTLSTTESTTPSVTESTTLLTTESSTPSATESTTTSTTESTTPSATESTTPSTTESTTTSSTESSNLTTTESINPSAESTTMSTTESTTLSATESTIPSATESITPSVTESTTTSSTESSTLSTTESTTPLTTESTTVSTTESSTLSATESTTTESTTLSTTESTTPSVTESTTKSTTESTISTSGEQTTTERSEEGTSEQSTQSTTEYSAQSTTEQLGQSTTEQLGESTTTERLDGSTTEKSGEKTTTETSLTTTGATDTSTGKPSAENCPETEEDQYLFVCPSSFRRHPKYCNIFYQCDENEETHDIKIAMFTCPNNTIYDESQTKCVQESKAQKPCDGEVAQKRRVKRKDRIGNNINDPIEVTEDSYACTGAGFYAFEKDGDCSPGFLKCTTTKSNKLRGLVYQCPAGYLFWTVSRRCEPIYKINDCRRSLVNNWSRRWEIPVERRNVAW